VQKGVIRKGNQIFVAPILALRTKIIAALHDIIVGGHSGSLAIYHRVKRLFLWKGLESDVKLFVQQCLVCQHAKSKRVLSPGLLQPLPIPHGAWQDFTMDFIEGLPKSEGCDTILVVVDRYSKYAHFFALRHPFSTATVAQMFLDNVVKLHGTSKSLVSYRDKICTNHFWKSLFQSLDTKLALTTAYHPQSDGQSERVNQCMEMYLTCAVHDCPVMWKRWLPLGEFWYNSSYHTALGCSPFKALYGYDPVFAAAPVLSEEKDQYVHDLLMEREHCSEILKSRLATAHNRMKIQADKRRSDRVFQEGKLFLLKL
jgi:hypothetical protein